MSTGDFVPTILEFLGEQIDRPMEHVDPLSTDLIGEEILDSLRIFSLIGFLEDKYQVEIEAEEITLDNFRTIDRLRQLVESKLPN